MVEKREIRSDRAGAPVGPDARWVLVSCWSKPDQNASASKSLTKRTSSTVTVPLPIVALAV